MKTGMCACPSLYYPQDLCLNIYKEIKPEIIMNDSKNRKTNKNRYPAI